MPDFIVNTVRALNAFIWGAPAIIAIIGVGAFLTVGTRFVQVRKFGAMLREIFGKAFARKESAEGSIHPFHAACTALAGTVGTGNIAGVAGAIALGGPGAIFWMWCAACLGMATKFVEIVAAVRYRERNPDGEWVGGPMYAIKNGLGRRWMWLAYAYAAFGACATFGIGNTTQANTICSSFDTLAVMYAGFGPSGVTTLNWTIGVILTLLLGAVLLGGIKRLGAVTGRMVPVMALSYFILALGVLVLRADAIPGVLASIFRGAFEPKAVTGGVVGSIFLCIQRGVSRGIFSNEAGLGTASIAHACADTDDAVAQGYLGLFEVFVDTIVICTLTALVILVSGISVDYGSPAGAELTTAGFVSVYGNWVTVFIAVAIAFFAFSTTLGWGLYGSRCVEFLFGRHAVKPFLVIYALGAILGATVSLGFVWEVADMFNGCMAVPNLLALLLLSGKLVRDARRS